MKKILLMGLSLVLVAVLAIGGTFAYLTDQESEVNVMTLGNVDIEQIEQERNAAGDLVDFTQAKPAYPAVGPVEWDDTLLNVNGTGYKVFTDELKNVVDKIVTVKNTGKSKAYVRTIVAIEAPEGDPNDLIHINHNSTGVQADTGFLTEIKGVTYYVVTFTYNQALAPKEVSAPSLMQVFLDSKTTNEDCAKFGETFDILVVSQAVQADGFADANAALTAGFGAVNAANVGTWFGETNAPVLAGTVEEMAAAIAAGEDVVLTADLENVDADATITVPSGKDVTLNLNGHTIKSVAEGTGNRELFLVKGDMTVENGTIEIAATVNQGWGAMSTAFDVTAGGVLNIENATIKNLGGTDMNFCVHLNNWGEVTLNVENSTLEATYVPVRVFNSGYDMNNVTIKNSTLNGKCSFWVHNYTSADFGTQEKADQQKALLNFDIFNGTNTFNCTGSAPVRYGFTNSVYFDANGNEVL